jgi:predicted lipid-binding transport protein (Tim44 family)|tara:strand:+ start:710 stop:1618 length:909 start_codon:yes stop_codon:yes gene_type:complete
MTLFLSRLLAVTVLAGSGLAMTAVTFDAEAKRFGGGFSSGRQSTNVMKQKQAVQAPAAAATAGAAATGAKAAGGSRWLGPIAGIAAGLGIAALLSHFGLGGALADMLTIALIVGLAFFAIRFIMGRLSGQTPLATQSAGAASNANRVNYQQNNMTKQAYESTGGGDQPSTDETAVGSWFVPADFDQATFLNESKKQYLAIQKYWDEGNTGMLNNVLTEDMFEEFSGQLANRQNANTTEVIILNADLLGIEKMSGGYLASVQFSGMIREDDNPDAKGFEEVWNLYKGQSGGWLLAGIQQSGAA